MWWNLTKEAHLEMVMETATSGRVMASALPAAPSPLTSSPTGKIGPASPTTRFGSKNSGNRAGVADSAFSSGSFFRMSGRRHGVGKRQATKRPSDGGGFVAPSPPSPPPSASKVASSSDEDRVSTSDAVVARLLVLASACQRGVRLLQQNSAAVLLFPLNIARGRRKERSGDGGQSPEEQKLYLQDQVLERKLTNADLKVLTGSPPGLDYNEWLASHTIAFFNHVNLIYGTISEYCTISGCPDMTGPGLRQYLWFDEKGKKTKVAAPQYIDYVMTFVQKTLNDESIFPTKFDGDFPPSFESLVKKILRLLFHVIAHLYHGHFKEIVMLNLHSHLNCLFAHLILFNDRYHMIDEKETEVLEDLVVALRLRDDNPKPPAGPSSSPSPLSDPATSSPSRQQPEERQMDDEEDKENCDTYCNVEGGTGSGGGGSNGAHAALSAVVAVATMDTSEHSSAPPGCASVLAETAGHA